MDFSQLDADDDIHAEATISVDVNKGHVFVGVYSGDMDGESYTIYVPNHREAISKLALQLFAVLEKTESWPEGHDGFSLNSAYKRATNSLHDEDEVEGVVNWY
jgi:hypothetical protein